MLATIALKVGKRLLNDLCYLLLTVVLLLLTVVLFKAWPIFMAWPWIIHTSILLNYMHLIANKYLAVGRQLADCTAWQAGCDCQMV